MYAVMFESDNNGKLLITCPDLPEVTSFGADEEEAMQRAVNAIEEALATRIEHDEDIPTPSAAADRRSTVPGPPRRIRSPIAAGLPRANRRMVRLTPLTKAKVELYRAMHTDGISKAELARRLSLDDRSVDRLLRLSYRSRIELIDHALRAIGKRLDVIVLDEA
ncbi:MAG TPA: type II toxin-antitoxin system HicB family antitoxin [Stellaceae bacterium]|nr:type II toxin-antitoxin system HicB family antitoxin [Stellaceae bacterium]